MRDIGLKENKMEKENMFCQIYQLDLGFGNMEKDCNG